MARDLSANPTSTPAGDFLVLGHNKSLPPNLPVLNQLIIYDMDLHTGQLVFLLATRLQTLDLILLQPDLRWTALVSFVMFVKISISH